MRFLVDECTGPTVARWLREHEHDVFSVYEEARGMDDRDVVQKQLSRLGFSSPMIRISASESIESASHTEELSSYGSRTSVLPSRSTSCVS
jgi:hypothetical protein